MVVETVGDGGCWGFERMEVLVVVQRWRQLDSGVGVLVRWWCWRQWDGGGGDDAVVGVVVVWWW
ncbi:hypothetical protein HanPI659440_Chr12g0466461 [Helianthus annuus]|nr:hypothetical protein HanLR1_Chr12g0452031 [Helianthus annuus]KAJ0726104.1 hypothetical protein HanPI659440_Chr12g0466461 [Helianthus annuus]